MARLDERRYEVRDRLTGEVMDVDIAPRRRAGGGGWMKLYQAATAETLRRSPKLRGQSLRVFLWQLSVVAWGNRLPAPVVAAEKLDIHRTDAYRTYRELLAAELILRHTDGLYYLNPIVAWKGTEAGLEAACRMLFHLGPDALALAPLPPPAPMPRPRTGGPGTA